MKVKNWDKIISQEANDRFEGGRIPDSAQVQVCMSKVKYQNESYAHNARNVMNAKHPQYVFKTYRCPVCRLWHLTKK